MSVEAPMGGMSVAVAAPAGPAMGGASFSGEMGSAQPFAGPSLGMEANGGSFSPGVNMAGLFSETSPFSASLASVPEGPVKGIADSFSREGDWAMLATGDKTSPSLHADVFMETTPFTAVESDVSERVLPDKAKSIFSDKNAWETVAKTKVAEVLDMEPNEWIDVVPKDTVKEAAVSTDSMADLFSVTKLFSPETPRNEGTADIDINKLLAATEAQTTEDAEIIPAEDSAQTNRVAELLVDVGIYSETDEAKQRVEEIVREANDVEMNSEPAVKGHAEVSADGETRNQTQAQAKPESQQDSLGNAHNEPVANEATIVDEEKPEEAVIPQRQPESKQLAEDKDAQSARKNTVKKIIVGLANQAEQGNSRSIRGAEIAAEAAGNPEHKSRLIEQVGLPDEFPDGSEGDALKQISTLGEIEVYSYGQVQQAEAQVDKILEENIPVEISNAPVRRATKEDAQKVLKFVKSPVVTVYRP